MIRKIGTACAAAATAALIAGASFAAPASAAAPCTGKPAGGDWPVYGHDAANTRSQPVPQGIGPDAVGGLKTAWVFSTASTGDNSGFESTPTVSGGCVFVGSWNGFAYALNASDGKLVWQRKLDVAKLGFGGALVGAPVVNGNALIYLVNVDGGPYAIALNRSTGAVMWRSDVLVNKPPGAFQGYYTNASPIVANGLVVAGYSPPEGDSSKTGGFALIDAGTGKIVKITETIPPADQAKGYAGGGLWSTPAYDPQTKYVYWGAGNPSSKNVEHPYTNAILKIDLNRSSATFGQVVGYYHGNVDQYTDALQTASHTPVCSATDNNSIPQPLDDPACGQLDLDFGASANLFTNSKGEKLVGDLQKSGVYHTAHADTMKPAWSNIVGVSCQTCNAASSAFDGKSIIGAATPEAAMFSLGRDDGSVGWLAPFYEPPIHFQSVSVADGVAYTLDNNGFLDAWDAASGKLLVHRLLSVDAGTPVPNQTSSGVAIAQHMLFVAAGGLGTQTSTGYLLAYRP